MSDPNLASGAFQSSDDLESTEAAGYKPGQKKTVDELKDLDKNDESLNKWKESLGLGKAVGPADDPRRIVVLWLALEVEGRPDVKVDLSTPEAVENAKTQTVTIKEGVEYRLKVCFKVQHEVVSGLKYVQVVKRKGVRVDKTDEMIGSYGPAAEPYEKKFAPEEAPSGMLSRGTYQVRSRFVDDDSTVHMDWNWQFSIGKDWA